MSVKVFSNNRLLWFKAIHGTIAKMYRERIHSIIEESKVSDNADEYNEEYLIHLNWRMAYNYYQAKDYMKAYNIFQIVCGSTPLVEGKIRRTASSELDEGEENLHQNSYVHEIAGRCCIELFLSTESHHYLEEAYNHFQNAIDTLTADLYAMFRLPSILLQFGRVLEYFGALENAVEVYGKILNQFPSFTGYFDAMYRTAIVGLHTAASFTKDVTAKEETIKKCIDIIQFLLEALPSSISEVHIMFVYARALELSSNIQLQVRSMIAYQSFFNLCRQHNIFSTRTKFKQSEIKLFLESSTTWELLGDYFILSYEYFIGKEAYTKCFEEKKKEIKLGNDFLSVLNPDLCLKVAQVYAAFQAINEATQYAEMGYKINRFHYNIRYHLSKWNTEYQILFSREVKASSIIKFHWKKRCWTDGFLIKLRQYTIKQLEIQWKQSPYDYHIRQQLSYLSRQYWRPKFFYEEYCIKKIQLFFHNYRIYLLYIKYQKKKLFIHASELHLKYSKHPFDKHVRYQIQELFQNKYFSSIKHPINKIKKSFDKQYVSIKRICQTYITWKLKKGVNQLVQHRIQLKKLFLNQKAMKIQCLIRIVIAKKRLKKLMIENVINIQAAIIIQQFIRWRNTTFQHAVTRVILNYKRRIARAIKVLMLFISFRIKRYLKYIRTKKHLLDAKRRKRQIEKKRKEYLQLVDKSIRILQRFCRNTTVRRWTKILSLALKERRNAFLSSLSQKLLRFLDSVNPSSSSSSSGTMPYDTKGTLRKGSTMLSIQSDYHVPGLQQTSSQFISLLNQEYLWCKGRSETTSLSTTGRSLNSPVHSKATQDGHVLSSIDSNHIPYLTNPNFHNFTSTDCLMTSIVLRHSYCAIRHLILYHIQDAQNPCYEFDLLPALVKCKSLRAINIIGGHWSGSFLNGLINLVQMENPRINELSIEEIYHPALFSADLSLSTGRLLMDYFNYSIPGIQYLSLHGCSLQDSHVESIVSGLSVNTSLKAICLSMNLITHVGFTAIFLAVTNNKKTCINSMDFSWNMIRDHHISSIKSLFDNYISPSRTSYLEIYLQHNLLTHFYIPRQHFENKHTIQNIRIIYFNNSSSKSNKLKSTKVMDDDLNLSNKTERLDKMKIIHRKHQHRYQYSQTAKDNHIKNGFSVSSSNAGSPMHSLPPTPMANQISIHPFNEMNYDFKRKSLESNKSYKSSDGGRYTEMTLGSISQSYSESPKSQTDHGSFKNGN